MTNSSTEKRWIGAPSGPGFGRVAAWRLIVTSRHLLYLVGGLFGESERNYLSP